MLSLREQVLMLTGSRALHELETTILELVREVWTIRQKVEASDVSRPAPNVHSNHSRARPLESS